MLTPGTPTQQSAETGHIRRAHREVLQMIADRTDERTSDPGQTVSCATFADPYTVFVHWRTARALHARGLIEYPYKGGRDEGWSIALMPHFATCAGSPDGDNPRLPAEVADLSAHRARRAAAPR